MRRTRAWAWASAWASALVALAVFAAAGCQYTSDLDLPDQQAESSLVMWSDGSVLTTLHAEQDREPISLSAMAPTLPTAVVAIEDERFFDHDGVDVRAVLRALTHDVEKGKVAEGGSTITQQYVRAVMLGPEQDLRRKLREAVLAMQLERKYPKKTILERYLNTIYFGNGAYGAQAAARYYFGRDAKDVNLAQSALLAGVIRAPQDYDPYRHPERSLARRNEVLDRLRELGRAPIDQIDAAASAPLGVIPHNGAGRSPAAHFVDRVRQFVLDHREFGPTRDARQRRLLEGGLRIQTTLDHHLQDLAEQAIAKVIVAPATDPAAALVALDPVTGAVRAYVGGPNYFGSSPWAKLDLAGGGCRGDGRGCRQAGSTFKPFVLAAALDAGVPLSRRYDAPGTITIPQTNAPPWVVHNYDGEGGGKMNLTEATVNSVNTVYAQLVTDVGAQPVVDLATRMGVRSPLGAFPSAALGTNGVTVLDMASAYSTLAGDGLHAEPVIVSKVTTRDGTVLWRAPENRRRELSVDTTRTVTKTLQQVVERGTGVNARIGRPVAGKTGTGEEWSDAWFVGYTPELVAAVWVGFPDAERSMRPPTTRITVTGGTWPAQIWQLFAGAALAEKPATPFPAAAPPAPTPTTKPDGDGAGYDGPTLIRVVGMPALAAAGVLRDAGYVVETDAAPSRIYPPGYVTSQQPATGHPIRPGATVTITIATGPPRTLTVPGVLGELSDQAAGRLRNAGFDVDVVVSAEPPPGSPARVGRVWKQSPFAGAHVDEGTTVVLTVNP